MPQVGVVIDGQDSFSLNLVPWQEAVVEAVLLGADHLWKRAQSAWRRVGAQDWPVHGNN